ncbi:helix-turn-helix domain-containing protein [Embleya sp. NPDC020886]|uniref:helix-turn-helix domain-containing protein n=1 Tax=Embleya sp. NPDC020886 TaxID=3363980 RepID=UPI0037A63E98
MAGIPLPDPARVFVVATDSRDRARAVQVCTAVTADLAGSMAGGTAAWTWPCPYEAGHALLLVPAAATHFASDLHAALHGALPGRYRVAASAQVPVAGLALGYGQALAKLAGPVPGRAHVAAESPTEPGLAPLVGALGRRWAAEFLAPARAHRGARPQDPSGEDLVETLRVWLAVGRAAPGRLYVHRNTLASRLRLVGELLGVDLAGPGGQAVADIALRFDALPPRAPASAGGAATAPPRFEDVIRQPQLRAWARALLAPVTSDPVGGGSRAASAETLRVWPAHDCRAPASAAALVLSEAGLRKRLGRLGERLGFDLRSAAAQCDLWPAVRISGG